MNAGSGPVRRIMRAMRKIFNARKIRKEKQNKKQREGLVYRCPNA
jgi:hypothetical protein